jgi:hypothetical protein
MSSHAAIFYGVSHGKDSFTEECVFFMLIRNQTWSSTSKYIFTRKKRTTKNLETKQMITDIYKRVRDAVFW